MRLANIGWIVGMGVWILASGAQGLDLEARLEREVVRPGERVQLTLRLRGGDGSETPDLRPLERDFRVLDVGRSFRSQSVNGRYEQSVDWVVSLLPRRSGSLEIPAVEVAGAHSHPQRLEVIDSAGTAADPASPDGAAAAGSPPVFVEIEVDEPAPYVQAEVALRVRLFADARVRGGTLSDPVAEDAVVERVGEDRQYRERRHGSDYAVVERRYAIFPQRSGPLDVAPAVFEGHVREERPARRARRGAFGAFSGTSLFDDAFAGGSLFDDFFGGGLFDEMLGGGGRPLRAEGPALSLQVRPRPEGTDAAWWIPARDVELIERWPEGTPTFRVGKPVERLIAIRARGISVSQLPELEVPSVDGLKQYSRPVADETVATGEEVVAVRARTSTLIPTRVGTFSLPALELDWWDTESERPRIARLPARSIEVLPARGAAAGSPALPGLPDLRASPPSQPSASDGATPAWVGAGRSSAVERVPRGIWWAGGLALVAGAAGLGWGLARRGVHISASRRSAEIEAGAPPTPRLAQAERKLRAACRSDDPGAASRALAEAGAARWPAAPPLDAGDWAGRLGGGALARAVETLQRVRYSPEAGEWEGSILWQAYDSSRRKAAATSTSRSRSALPDLYPSREPLGIPR